METRDTTQGIKLIKDQVASCRLVQNRVKAVLPPGLVVAHVPGSSALRSLFLLLPHRLTRCPGIPKCPVDQRSVSVNSLPRVFFCSMSPERRIFPCRVVRRSSCGTLRTLRSCMRRSQGGGGGRILDKMTPANRYWYCNVPPCVFGREMSPLFPS